MGRIAEALKKAETERMEKLRLGILEQPRPSPGKSKDRGPHRLIAGRMRGVSASALLDSSCRQPLPFHMDAPLVAENQQGSHDKPWAVHRSLVSVTERAGPIAEQYRAIRTWLISQASQERRLCLAVTSSIAREGKSVTLANLAAAFSEISHLKTLAVDADLRQGSLARLFNISRRQGLADALQGRAVIQDILAPTPIPNLSLVPAGSLRAAGSTDLLSSRAAVRLFDEFRERFDVVLVDTPAVQGLSDAGVVGALCSGMLMVVKLRSTPSSRVQESIQRLQENHLRVIGCIATSCDARIDSRCTVVL